MCKNSTKIKYTVVEKSIQPHDHEYTRNADNKNRKRRRVALKKGGCDSSICGIEESLD